MPLIITLVVPIVSATTVRRDLSVQLAFGDAARIACLALVQFA